MDIRTYCIVDKKEDEQAYLYQEKILNDKKMMQEEKIIRIAIVLADRLQDYETPVKMLYDLIQKNDCLEALVLGCYWVRFCSIICPNIFLQKLLERLNVLNSEMKAVVKYLEADYLWVENEISEEKYRELLEKAISYSDRCVSCYIDLARVYGVTSERGKQLIKVAVTKIDEVYDVNDELKMDLYDTMCYSYYYKKYIKGACCDTCEMDYYKQLLQ